MKKNKLGAIRGKFPIALISSIIVLLCLSSVVVSQTIPPPVITQVFPPYGPMEGGIWIRIDGQNFRSGATVRIGSNYSTRVVVVDSTVLFAILPPGTQGTFNVRVTNPDGQTYVFAEAFTYLYDTGGQIGVGVEEDLYNVNEGEIVEIEAYFLDFPRYNHMAVIDWGDGTFSRGDISYGPMMNDIFRWGYVDGSHVYGDNGRYVVRIYVVNQAGAAGVVGLTVNVINVPPSTMQFGNQVLSEGNPTLSFQFTFTDPGRLDTHMLGVVWGDGAINTIDPVTSPVSLSHTYPSDNGTYTVKIIVTDDDNASDGLIFNVVVNNENPVGSKVSDKTVVESNPTVSFSFTFTDPGALDTHTLVVNWGDKLEDVLQNVKSPVPLTHTYSTKDDGSYTVNILLEDDDKGSYRTSFTVIVMNEAPVISPVDPQTIPEGNPQVGVGIAFTDPGVNDTHRATIAWGDGITDTINPATSPISARHTYSIKDDAEYMVTVTVTDNGGGTATQTFPVVVVNELPVVKPIDNQSAPENNPTFAVRVEFTDPSTRDTHRAIINWGDDKPATIIDPARSPVTPSYTYSRKDDAQYTVTVTIEDDDGGSSSQTFIATVTNRNPDIFPLSNKSAPESNPSISFSASFTDPGTEDTHAAIIDWGDSQTERLDPVTSPFTAKHTYPADGAVYTVSLTVVDDDGGSDTETFTVTIISENPTLAPIEDQTIPEGNPTVTFTASFAGSSPAGAVSDVYTVTIDWGDGSANTISPAVSPVKASHTYSLKDDAKYTVKVTVTDDDGGSDTESFIVTVINEVPVIKPADDQSILEGNPTVALAVSFTDPGVNDTHRATIAWGDGNTDTISPAVSPVNATHTYSLKDDAKYTVTVTVTDDNGGSDTETFAVVVTNQAPVMEPLSDQSILEGDPTANLNARFTDPGANDGHTATVDWGDGSTDTIPRAVSPITAVHTYSLRDDAKYTVTVTVTDDDGGSDTETFAVTVSNQNPVVSVSGDQRVPEGNPTVKITANFTDPGVNDTHRATIAWGDDNTDTISPAVSPVNASHTYSLKDDAKYTVTVTVADDDGGSDTETFAVTVSNEIPVISPVNNISVLEGSPTVAITSSFSDPGTQDTHTAAIAWGDGKVDNINSATNPITISHTYPGDDGVYTASITVTDDNGGSGKRNFTVTVSNEAPIIDPINNQSILEGDPVLDLSIGFVDHGLLDTHGVVISWGDGRTDTVDNAISPVSISHRYTGTTRERTASVTVRDDDGGSDTETFSVILTNEKPVIDPIGNQSAPEGNTTISLSVTYTDPGAPSAHRATVLWGDGNSEVIDPAVSPIKLTHTYPGDDGRYAASVTVEDDSGGSDTKTFTVNVFNQNPNMDPVSNQSIPEGDPTVNIAASFTDPGANDTHTATINWGDGNTNTISQAVNPITAVHTYSMEDDAQYTVTVTVTDDDGGSDSETFTVAVTNQAPALDPISDQSVPEGEPTVTLNANFVDPGSMDTHTATIDWGDGKIETVIPSANSIPASAGSVAGAVAVTHTYPEDDGEYTVTLTVSDDDGGSDAESFAVTVANQAPVLDPIPDQEAPGDKPTVTVNASFTDPGTLDTHTVVIDWGDGSTDTVEPAGGSVAGRHTYASDAGQYRVTVTVRDDDGGTDTESFMVEVGNVPPVVNAGADMTVTEGQRASVRASFTDADAASCTAQINWGDGTVEPAIVEVSDGSGTATGSHVYTASGAFTVVVTVTDTEGGSGTDRLTVTVNPLPVTVTGISPDSGPVAGGTNITITGGNFKTGAKVNIGSAAATSVVVASSTRITARTPSGSAGVVDVIVTNPDGQKGTLAKGFTYIKSISRISISPLSAVLKTGQTQQFSVSATDSAGNPSQIQNTDVNWGVGDSDVGSINSSGLFTAVNPGTTTVSAVLKSDSTIRAEAQAEVEDAEPPSVLSEDLFPEYESKNVPVTASIPIRFSEPIDMGSVEDDGIIVRGQANRRVEGEFSFDPANGVLLFTPDETLKDEETITVIISTAVMDLAGNRIQREFRTSFTTGISIWPGDSDNDGKVGVQDIIPLGREWGKTGPARDETASEWELQPGIAWTDRGAAYADTNGDGEVNEEDVMPIAANWNLTHSLNQLAPPQAAEEQYSLADPQLLGVYEAMYGVLADAPAETEGVKALKGILRELIANIKLQALPRETRLLQNYPNPFNPETWIPYQLAEDAFVRVSIYHISGALVQEFQVGQRPAGYYVSKETAVYWDGRNRSGEQVSSGIYFCHLQAGHFQDVRKLIIAR